LEVVKAHGRVAMPLTFEPDLPPLRVDETGTVRVGKTRVLLVLVVEAFQEGATPEEIVQMYDTLTLVEAYGAIAYYLGHREEVEAYIAEYEREAEEVRKKVEAAQRDLPDIRQRLLARREKRNAS
jgi:uncharacterized protein (DUF433 family)